ncbi:hypothetical protein [Celeribacter sp.]|uniref:hypothetical protein n=1 Tax=Celeribacter sp. TaxID=1890673 RepID=UPI003A8EEE81
MKKQIVSATVLAATVASPVLAHEGHATLPGAHGHTEAHLLIAALAVAVVWLAVNTIKGRKAKRKEE